MGGGAGGSRVAVWCSVRKQGGRHGECRGAAVRGRARGALGLAAARPPVAVPVGSGLAAWWMCSAGGSWSARMAAAWTPRRPCRIRSWACTSPPAGARRAATSLPSSATSTWSWWRRPSPPPLSRSSSSRPTTAPRRWWATCAPCTATGWPCPSTTPTSSEYRGHSPEPCPSAGRGRAGGTRQP